MAPAADGNFSVARRLAIEVLTTRRSPSRGEELLIESEGDLIEAVKIECARLWIAYGHEEGVRPNVVQDACGAAWAMRGVLRGDGDR